jgi:hypothetical protein
MTVARNVDELFQVLKIDYHVHDAFAIGPQNVLLKQRA